MIASPLATNVWGDVRLLNGRPIARPGLMIGSRRGALLLLVVLGLSTTLYIDLGSVGGNAIRPVQLVPWLLGPIVYLFVPCRRLAVKAIAPYFFLPALYVAYIAVRHVPTGSEGVLYLIKAAGNLVAYWSVVRLLMRVGVPDLGYLGIIFGSALSTWCSAMNLSLWGVHSHMWSGRWQGFMPGANRFANICLLAAIPLFGLLLQRHHGKGIKALAAGLWLVCMGGIIMSGSRGALGVAVVGHILIYALAVRTSPKTVLRWQPMAAVGVALLGMLASIWAFHDSIPDRLAIFAREHRFSYTVYEADSRRELHSIAFNLFWESPLVGEGVDAQRFEVEFDRHRFRETSSHSSYLHLLSVSGVLGLIFYLLLPVFLVVQLTALSLHPRRTFTSRQRMSCIIALVVMISLGLHATVISLTNTMHVWVIFGVATFAVMEMRKRPLQLLLQYPPCTHGRPE